MIKRIIFILSLILSIIIGAVIIKKQFNSGVEQSNDFYISIPFKEQNFSYQHTVNRSKQLKFDSILSGFDSLQIRFWYEIGRWNPKMLFIVTKPAGKDWTFKRIEYYGTNDLLFPIDTTVQPIISYLKPVKGTSKFIKNLQQAGLFELQGLTPKELYNWCVGFRYDIEIASKTEYKHRSYVELEYYKNLNKDIGKMIIIDSLFKSDLKLIQ